MAKVEIDMHNQITSEEMIEILKKSAETVANNDGMAHIIPPAIIRGAPGAGKSAIVKQIAKDLGIEFIDVRLAQLERVDVAGLPSVENGVTKWNVPSFWPRDPKSKGILFFDEITSAPSDVQVACYSLILDRKIPNSDYEIPEHWYIISAGNRVKDRAVAKPMSSALANRFVHFELDADSESWTMWAIGHDIHPSVTGFIKYRPNFLHCMENQNLEQGFPTPRSWERVSSIIPLYKDNEDILRKVVYGLIGNQVGLEFLEFYKINAKFEDVLEMMTNPKAKIEIPKKADRLYALCSTVSYLIWNGANEKETTARVDGMYRIAMEMTDDFATLMVKMCMAGNSKVSKIQACSNIARNKAYPAFNKKFGSSFMKTKDEFKI